MNAGSMTHRPTPRLECLDLSKSFDGTAALSNISLKFESTGCIAIIGPNGAGKTTLINSLTGYVRLDRGNWLLGRRRLTGLKPYRIARLGVARTFQDVRLALQDTVLNNVLLARPRQLGENAIAAILGIRRPREEAANLTAASDFVRYVGLENYRGELAANLSYGQQKLLGIACCLATDASILVLDEPVAGVDPSMSGRILELLKTLSSQGKLIIFIEHDIEAVRQIADRVIVMDAGRVIADGNPGEVLGRDEIVEAYLV